MEKQQADPARPVDGEGQGVAAPQRIRELEAQLAAHDAVIATLRAALKKYGQHRYPCPMGGDWVGSVSRIAPDAVCNCGLDALNEGQPDAPREDTKP